MNIALKISLDTQVCLFSSFAILSLGLSLHWANHYPLDWINIIHTAFFIFLGGLTYIAGSIGQYPKASSLGRTVTLCFFIGLCSMITLHVLPLSPFPMVDPQLALADKILNFNTGSFATGMQQYHPALNNFLWHIYKTLIPLSFLCILALPWASPHKAREFVLLVSITSFLGFFIYFFWPAIGPMASYHYAMHSSELALLKHIHLLKKEGAASHLFLSGDISFPSFHTIIALLAAWVWRDYKIIFIPLGLLSFLIILSTLSTGWHYLSDVLAGVLISVISIFFTHIIFKFKIKNNKSFELADLIPSAPQVG